MELLNSLGVRIVWCALDHPDILVLLEASRYISSESTFLFKGEVLGFVLVAEVMAHDLTFSTEIVSVSDIITSKVVHSLSVADKNWFSSFYGFSLPFHTEVRITSINDPSTNIMVIRVNTGFLLARLRGIAESRQRSAANVQSLSVDVGIRFNFDFLTEPNDIVSSEDIDLLCSLDDKHGARNRTRVFLASSEDKCITISTLLSLVNVHDKVSAGCFVLQHNRVA